MAADPLKIAFVVATKDRPADLRNLLASLASQSRLPDEVIIVDASAEPVTAVVGEFPTLPVRYIRHLPPSASAQRNAGVKAVGEGIDLVGFLDDDAVLEPGAMEAMMRFWETAGEDVGGASFNWMNPARRSRLGGWLKRTWLCEALGLYSRRQGAVMPSGWQTLAVAVPETMNVQWLPSGASVWRRKVFEEHRFDEWFDGYSYLEDLDFSYGVSKKYKLAVVAEAGFRHYPSPSSRTGGFKFGRLEVANRLFVVRKHGLSIPRCYLALVIRMFGTLAMAAVGGDFRSALGRLAGNFAALCRGGRMQMR
ncbi:MAG: glycosyltransferase family 2 protein [Phycisphaerae bacterium]